MHTLLRRSLVVLLPLLAACSSGGGGGAGPQPGSDEWHEQQARQASTQAKADLRERLKNVDRCAPTQQQMADVFEAMARTQGLGTDTDAEAQAAQTTLQPAIRAIARAFARGDATGMTSQTIVNLAEWTGLDTAGSAWMEDPSCNWVVTLRVLSLSAVPGVSGRLEMTSKVPLQTNVVTGQVSGSARMDVTAQMQSPPPCTVTFQPATTDSTVAGQERGGKLALLISYAAYTVQGVGTCDLPVGRLSTPSSVPMEAMKDFPLSVEARNGATATDERGVVTVTVNRVR